MLSIHPGRICPPMQSKHSVLLGVLSLCRMWKSISVKNFKKSAMTIYPSTGCRLIRITFSSSDETAVFETSMIHCLGKHGGMPTRRWTQIRRTLQGHASQVTTTFKILILNSSALIECKTARCKLCQMLLNAQSKQGVYVCILGCVVCTQYHLRD